MSSVPPDPPPTPPDPPPGPPSPSVADDHFYPFDDIAGYVGATATAGAPPGPRTPSPPPPPGTVTPSPPPRPAAGEPVGDARYALGPEIGQGAMGCVYAGVDADFGRDVAVKLLLDKHLNKPDLCWRFVAEARITARLQHPGIVPLYAIGTFPDGRPYYVMRLIEGQTLAALLAARACPKDDRPRFLKAFEKVCEALAYAHQKGVIHRDIKPANVMLGPFGVVKVMDWGVAKVMPHSPLADADPEALAGLDGPPEDDLAVAQTQLGRVLGTPAYMAPEQAAGRVDELDERSDVFGLGAVLCTILTGAPPYDRATAKEVFRQAFRSDLSDAHARLDACGADPDLVALCKRCLSPDPNDRPRDAAALAAEFTAFLERDLRRAESDMTRFFELSPDLFCIAGLDGYFRRVNPNFSRVLGYTADELTAKPFLDFVHLDDRPATEGVMAALNVGDPCVRFRNRYRAADGSYRWFEWSAKPCPVERVVFAVARDVTGQMELERQVIGMGGE